MKCLATLLLAITLVGCASIPIDPNLATLAASDERKLAAEHAHQEALATARAKAAEACAKSPEPAVCALGQVAMALAGERASAAPAQPSALANYTPPESGFDKLLRGTGVVGNLVLGAGQVWANVENNRESNRTTRYVAGVNAERELGTVQAITGLGTAIANQPPGIVVGGNLGDTYGDDFTGGNRTDVRVENTGVIGDGNEQRQNSDNLDNVGNCVAGTGGDGGRGAPGANGGAGAAGGNAGSGGENAGGTAGPGGDGAPGGTGGIGGLGGNGGNCTGGRP